MTKITPVQFDSQRSNHQLVFDGKLAAYLAAAGAIGTAMASEAKAVVVASNSVVPFGTTEGVNDQVNIDFNGDGQTDFQIDHDRVNLGGQDLDFLQLDKNDVSSAANPLAIDAPFFTSTFPTGATTANNPWEDKYVNTIQGGYPSALTQGTLIGPASTMDFQEVDNFNGSGKYLRTNRLIDEDAGQIDTAGGNPYFSPLPDSPHFLGLGGAVRYLGVRMSLNGGILASNGPINYGWIGIQITNDADATGNVVGWGYETQLDTAIRAGAPNGAPEPGSIVMAAMGGGFLLGAAVFRKYFGIRKNS